MSLIVVTTSAGDIGPFNAAMLLRLLQDLLKASDAAEKFWRQPHPFTEFGNQMLVTESKSVCSAPNRPCFWRLRELLQSKRDYASALKGLPRLDKQENLKDLKLFRRRRSLQQFVAQVKRDLSPDGFEFDDL